MTYRLARRSSRLIVDASPSGGTFLSAPVRVREGEEIVDAYLRGVGTRPAYGSRAAKREAKQRRTEAILDAYGRGATWDAIMETFRVSQVTIRLILKRAEERGDRRVRDRRAKPDRRVKSIRGPVAQANGGLDEHA